MISRSLLADTEQQANRPDGAIAGLEPMAGSGTRVALPSGIPSGSVAVLVGFRLWDDGRPRCSYTGSRLLGFEARALTSVEATSLDLNPDTHPLASIVTYRFGARDNLPPVKLTWYDGLRPPRQTELEDMILSILVYSPKPVCSAT